MGLALAAFVLDVFGIVLRLVGSACVLACCVVFRLGAGHRLRALVPLTRARQLANTWLRYKVWLIQLDLPLSWTSVSVSCFPGGSVDVFGHA